jgi:hypothetical protein
MKKSYIEKLKDRLKNVDTNTKILDLSEIML